MPIPVHVSSLITKMLMFTLNHLLVDHMKFTLVHGPTFQVPMQYHSLQHWTLLSPPGTSTAEHCFCFGPAASVILELSIWDNCLLPYPRNILDTFQPGGLIFWCYVFLLFCNIHGVRAARILERFVIPSSTGPCFVRPLHYDASVLGGLTWHGL